MIATTYGGTSVLILNHAPSYGDRVQAAFDLVAQYEEGLTGREARRAYGATLRASLQYQTLLDGPDAIPFAASMRTYQAQPVAVPLWPAQQTWANRASIAASGLKIAFKSDWSQWEIYTTVEPSWPAASDTVAPLLWGRLENREVKWVNSSVLTYDVRFVEASPAAYALVPNSATFPAGPSLSGYGTAPDLFPFALDWAGVPEKFSFRVIRDQLGFGRQPTETTYPQSDALEAKFAALLQSSADLWQFLRFFATHGGGTAFWCPSWRAVGIMSADLAGGSTALSVNAAHGISAGDYLAFVQGTGVTATARATAVSGGSITLGTAPGALAASQTVVAPLVLARLEKPRASVEWLNADVASVSISVSEQPGEYAPASDETLGTTIGALTTRGYVYELAQTINGSTTTTRLTSYEQDLTVGGNTYTARKMDHGSVKGSLFLDRDEVEVRTEIVAGDPFVKVATAQAEAPLRITIKSVDVSGSTGTNAAVLFTGDVTTTRIAGSRITARCVSAGTLFDRLYPRVRLQPGCNFQLFSTGCGLLASDWKFSASVNGTPTAGYPFALALSGLARVSGSMPTITAGWFAGGWVEIGSGATFCRRPILNNTAASGGGLTLTLSRDPNPMAIAGATVYLFPGCNGDFTTCSGKFANQLNFGGHPFMPPSNPSLIKMSQNLGGGKK